MRNSRGSMLVALLIGSLVILGLTMLVMKSRQQKAVTFTKALEKSGVELAPEAKAAGAVDEAVKKQLEFQSGKDEQRLDQINKIQ